MISDGKAAFTYFDLSSALSTGSISINCQKTTFDTNTATGSGGLFSISSGYKRAVDLTFNSVISKLISVTGIGGGGGILYTPPTSTSSTVTIGVSTFISNTVAGNGGLFYLEGTNSKSVTFNTATSISGTSAGGKGGLIYINSKSQNVVFSGVTLVENTQSTLEGGIYYPEFPSIGPNTLSLTLFQSTFTNFKSPVEGSFLVVKSLGSPVVTVSIS